MRGFLSFVLVLSFVFSIFLLFYYYQIISFQHDETKIEILTLENYNLREQELKRAIIHMIEHESRDKFVEGKTIDEVTDEIGEKLASLENLENFYYENFGLKVDFWCGSITDEELKEIPEKMLRENEALKCKNCKDFDEISLRTEYENEREVTSCTAFLSLNPIEKSITISSPDLRVTPQWTISGKVAYGVSILDEENKISSIVLIPINSKIKW